MARAKTEPRKKPVFVVRSFKLTRDTDETLHQLAQDATDAIGRAVSASAIVRALLRQAKQHSSPSHLFSFIGAELSAGVMWGKRK